MQNPIEIFHPDLEILPIFANSFPGCGSWRDLRMASSSSGSSSSEEQGITFSTTFASWLQDKHPSARPSKAPQHWGPHSCCAGYRHHLHLHLCQEMLSSLCIGVAMLHKDLESTLHQLLCSAKISQRVMNYSEIEHSNRHFWMIFPVVLLQDSQGTLEQVLLLPGVA